MSFSVAQTDRIPIQTMTACKWCAHGPGES